LIAVCLVAAPADRGQSPVAAGTIHTGDDAAYAADAIRLCAQLESWPGEDPAETSRLLAEAFVEPLSRHYPGITKEQLRALAHEFEPRIWSAFQNLAANISRQYFTHAELQELIRFYETPLGRKYARAYPDWKNRIAAGDAERKQVADELFNRARELTRR
jgi:hypothetical protein